MGNAKGILGWEEQGVFRDSRGQWTLGFNMRIDHATNIYMEILAILHGVKIDLKENLLPLIIETDCLELTYLFQSKNYLYKNLLYDCRYLLGKANDPPVKHIFREANGVADLLAKNGCSLDSFCFLHTYVSPPAFVLHVRERDSLDTLLPRLTSRCNSSQFVVLIKSSITKKNTSVHAHRTHTCSQTYLYDQKRIQDLSSVHGFNI